MPVSKVTKKSRAVAKKSRKVSRKNARRVSRKASHKKSRKLSCYSMKTHKKSRKTARRVSRKTSRKQGRRMRMSDEDARELGELLRANEMMETNMVILDDIERILHSNPAFGYMEIDVDGSTLLDILATKYMELVKSFADSAIKERVKQIMRKVAKMGGKFKRMSADRIPQKYIVELQPIIEMTHIHSAMPSHGRGMEKLMIRKGEAMRPSFTTTFLEEREDRLPSSMDPMSMRSRNAEFVTSRGPTLRPQNRGEFM